MAKKVQLALSYHHDAEDDTEVRRNRNSVKDHEVSPTADKDNDDKSVKAKVLALRRVGHAVNKRNLPNAEDLKLAMEFRNGQLPTKMQEKLDSATKKFYAAKSHNQSKRQKHDDLEDSDSSDTRKQHQSKKSKTTTMPKSKSRKSKVEELEESDEGAQITSPFQKVKGRKLPIGTIYGEDFYTVEHLTRGMANFQKRKDDRSVEPEGRRGGRPTKQGKGPDGEPGKPEKQQDGVPSVKLQEFSERGPKTRSNLPTVGTQSYGDTGHTPKALRQPTDVEISFFRDNSKSAALANNIIRDVRYAVAVIKSSALMHNRIVRSFVDDFSSNSNAFTILPEGDYNVLYNTLTVGDNYDKKLFDERKHIAEIANRAIHYLFDATRFLKDSVETHSRGVLEFLNDISDRGYEKFEIPSWYDWHKNDLGVR